MERERKGLLSSLEGLAPAASAEEGVTGSWAVKDILAHLTAWEEEAVKRLQLLIAGREQEVVYFDEEAMHAFNAAAAKRYGERPLPQALELLTSARALLEKTLKNELTEERLNAQEGRIPIYQWLPAWTYAHDAEHSAEIKAWRLKAGT